VTTVGFVEQRDGLRLAIVHYVRPMSLLRARPPRPLNVAGWEFPIVLRPWLPEQHGQGDHDGHCWVRTESGLGVLTALHCIQPAGSELGDVVTIACGRRSVRGRLHASSTVMDAAVILADAVPTDVRTYPHSSTIGYKPVRYLIGRPYQGQLDAVVTGLLGFRDNQYYRSTGTAEPPIAA
jgi:hypothetical protein